MGVLSIPVSLLRSSRNPSFQDRMSSQGSLGRSDDRHFTDLHHMPGGGQSGDVPRTTKRTRGQQHVDARLPQVTVPRRAHRPPSLPPGGEEPLSELLSF